MTRRDWNSQMPKVPKQVHKKVLETLEHLEEQEVSQDEKIVRRRFPVRLHPVAACIALFVAILGTTVAAARLEWHQRVLNMFGEPTEEVRQQMEDMGVAQFHNQSATDNGITVTLVQTIRDVYSLDAMFEVTSEEELIGTGSAFVLCWVITEDGERFLTQAHLQTDFDDGLGKKGYFHMSLADPNDTITFEKVSEPRTWTVRFSDYYYYTPSNTTKDSAPDREVNRIKGSWEITFDLKDLSEITRIYEPDMEIVLADVPVIVNKVVITPMNIAVYYDVDVDKFCAEGLLEDALEGLPDDALRNAVRGKVALQEEGVWLGGLLDQDGKKMDVSFSGAHGSDVNEGEVAVFSMKNMIDVDEVSAILLSNENIRIDLR